MTTFMMKVGYQVRIVMSQQQASFVNTYQVRIVMSQQQTLFVNTCTNFSRTALLILIIPSRLGSKSDLL